MISILKRINRFIRRWLFVVSRIGSVTRLVTDPKMARSYYPEEPRKSKTRVWLELMSWLVKHTDVNAFYYAYGFDLKKGVNQDEYIAYNEFKALRNSRNNVYWIGAHNTGYICLLKDKYAFYLLLSGLGYPTPKVVGVCIGDRIDWLDTRTTEAADSIMKRAGLRAFCKTLLGESAEGAFPCHVDKEQILLDGASITFAELAKRFEGGFIIQELIEQHPRMAELYPTSINTLRITTIRKGDDVILFSAAQRIGASELTRDNWAAGGLFGAIDERTGRLAREFKYQPGSGGIITRHPQTGVVFEGFEIPYFHEAVAMARELHSFLYGIHSIGWDVAITRTGPTFIEGNDNWTISAYQAVEGGLKAKFLDALGPAERGVSC